MARSAQAFTLVEVLIAITLFAVGMLSVLQIFPINRRFLTQSALATQAAFLAQEQMETVQSVGYAALTPGTYQPATAASSVAGDPLSIFTEQTTVTLVDGNWQNSSTGGSTSATDVGLKRITVLVTWNERAISRQYSLSAIFNAP